jgi:hypothetical protein
LVTFESTVLRDRGSTLCPSTEESAMTRPLSHQTNKLQDRARTWTGNFGIPSCSLSFSHHVDRKYNKGLGGKFRWRRWGGGSSTPLCRGRSLGSSTPAPQVRRCTRRCRAADVQEKEPSGLDDEFKSHFNLLLAWYGPHARQSLYTPVIIRCLQFLIVITPILIKTLHQRKLLQGCWTGNISIVPFTGYWVLFLLGEWQISLPFAMYFKTVVTRLQWSMMTMSLNFMISLRMFKSQRKPYIQVLSATANWIFKSLNAVLPCVCAKDPTKEA